MYTETIGQVGVPARQRLVWKVLIDALTAMPVDLAMVAVLDCGGGSGSFAVPLARAGVTVTVVDISVDALATLHRRTDEAGVAHRVHPVQGDVEALTDVVPASAFDLVLAHGVLESVDHIGPAFASVAAAVRPGGLLSVLVTNPIAGVLARALSGELVDALAEFHAIGTADAAAASSIHALCESSGLVVEQTHGVGVFSDLVPGSALERPGAADALAALEIAVAARSPFADIASRVHTLARRPG